MLSPEFITPTVTANGRRLHNHDTGTGWMTPEGFYISELLGLAAEEDDIQAAQIVENLQINNLEKAFNMPSANEEGVI